MRKERGRGEEGERKGRGRRGEGERRVVQCSVKLKCERRRATPRPKHLLYLYTVYCSSGVVIVSIATSIAIPWDFMSFAKLFSDYWSPFIYKQKISMKVVRLSFCF